MLQTTHKSQWLTKTKVCFSLLLHVLCGLASHLYSGNQTAGSTLTGPGRAGTEARQTDLAMAIGASMQKSVTSNAIPLAKPVMCVIIRMSKYDRPTRRDSKLLGTRTESATNMKLSGHYLAHRNPSINYKNH